MTRLNDFVSRYRRQLGATVGGALVLGVLAHAVAQPVHQPFFRSVESTANIGQNISAAQAGPILVARSSDDTLAEAKKTVSNIDLDLEESDVVSRKADLHKSAIDLEYEAALTKESSQYDDDLAKVEQDYHVSLSAVEADYASALESIETSYKATLEKAEAKYLEAAAQTMSEPARKVMDKAYNDGRDAAAKIYMSMRDAAGTRYNEDRDAANLAYNQALEAANFAHNNAYSSIQEAYGSVVYQDLQAQTADDIWALFQAPVSRR